MEWNRMAQQFFISSEMCILAWSWSQTKVAVLKKFEFSQLLVNHNVPQAPLNCQLEVLGKYL
jgi:hypothetical protein